MGKKNNSTLSRLDWGVLMIYIALALTGIMAVYTVEVNDISAPFVDFSKSYMRQLIWFIVSLLFGLIILFTDSKFFFSIAYLAFIIGIFLLFSTFALSSGVKGSHSFIKFGSFTFQPGELHKTFTALALARFISTSETNFTTLKERLIAAAIAMVPAIIIILQNETGLALVYFSFFLVMYREGLPNFLLFLAIGMIALVISSLLVERIPLLIAVTVIALLIGFLFRNQLVRNKIMIIVLVTGYLFSILFSQVIVPYAFTKVLQGYQVERIYSMFGQDVPIEFRKSSGAPRQDADYNVRQSKIAIGSGGLAGKGFMNGTQTKGNFVPEQHTDFVSCGIGEQFGFLGSMGLVVLYVLLIWRCIVIGERQRSVFSRVYAYSVASILFFHFAINIGMTIGLAPVIGITLPLLSYGGTSLLSFSILMFILLRLDMDRNVYIR